MLVLLLPPLTPLCSSRFSHSASLTCSLYSVIRQPCHPGWPAAKVVIQTLKPTGDQLLPTHTTATAAGGGASGAGAAHMGNGKDEPSFRSVSLSAGMGWGSDAAEKQRGDQQRCVSGLLLCACVCVCMGHRLFPLGWKSSTSRLYAVFGLTPTHTC